MKKILILAAILSSSSLFTQEVKKPGVLITDRPDQTESPNSVGVGVIQIESGLLFERVRENRNVSIHRTVYPTNLFRIGLLDNLELRVVNEVVQYKTIVNGVGAESSKIKGTENLQVGLKYQISESESTTQVGVMAHAVLPTGSEGISNKLYGVLSRVNISHDISDNKNISANFGYNNLDLDFTDEGLVKYQDGDFTYTLVYGVGLGDKVGLYVEAFGDYVNFENWENNMDAGMTYLLSNSVQLDYSYGWGLNRVMNYHSIGISVRLPE